MCNVFLRQLSVCDVSACSLYLSIYYYCSPCLSNALLLQSVLRKLMGHVAVLFSSFGFCHSPVDNYALSRRLPLCLRCSSKPRRAIARSLRVELVLTSGSGLKEGRNLSQWRNLFTGCVSSPHVVSVSCSSLQRLPSDGFSYACVQVR